MAGEQNLATHTPSFDHGGFVVGEALREAFLLFKGSRAVLAGAPFVDEIFRLLECSSKRIKDSAQSYGFRSLIAGTRNTTPGFRLVEKYGMLVCGIDPHWFNLSRSITAAIARVREVGGLSLLLDVEVRNEDEANEAIATGADVVMLDNIKSNELASVARS
ncbi:Quinolinate phosphoribosyl transferase [Russula compacta]|nr:Quinolinate phosphoribosyl transferase [Russula compacta]